jgi:glycosyltransferase involved in cell wall biosynthesis
MNNSGNKCIKILQPTDWPFQPMDDYIAKGGDAFSVSRFGYELFKDKNVDVDWIAPHHHKKITKILTKLFKLEGSNLILQCQLIKQSKNYDVIYYSADRHPYLLAFARKLRLCRTPVLMLCHFSYDTRAVDSKLKKLLLRMERKLVFSGLDQIVFNCKTLMNLAIEDGDLPERHRIICGWGADLNYFSRGRKGCHADIQPYYFAAGGANRDYHTIVEAFRKLPYRLVISCPKKEIEAESPLPENIIFFNYKKNGFQAYAKLRSYYYDSKAVLIPINHRNHVANGASVLVESLACGKPILISDLETNFIDVEKEQVGLKVRMHDVDDWVRAVNYLEEHSERLETMSQNAYRLAKEQYNYELFTEHIVAALRKLADKDK